MAAVDYDMAEEAGPDADAPRRQKGRGFQADREAGAERVQGAGAYDRLPTGREGEPVKSVEGWVIFVSGVHEEASEEELGEAFAEFGDIKNMYLNLDRRTGYVKGYALIEYASQQEAQDAIRSMNGQTLLQQKIGVSWAFSATPLSTKSTRRR